MKIGTLILAFVAVTMSFAPTTAISKNKTGHCPPGLAKKNPPCVPPGQVGKRPVVGGQLPGSGYRLVQNPSQYRLPKLGKGQSYYWNDNTFFRINRETREILELIDALGAVLN